MRGYERGRVSSKGVLQPGGEASHGIYSEFEPGSGLALRELLSSVAAFSAAGTEGLKRVGQAVTPQARQLQKAVDARSCGTEKVTHMDALERAKLREENLKAFTPRSLAKPDNL